MNKNELIAAFGRFIEEAMNQRNNDDYVVDNEQMAKLKKVAEFFETVAADMGGELDDIVFEPRLTVGDVTTKFTTFSVCGKRVKEFSEISSYCSAIGIDCMIDNRICISCTVPNVFVRKSKS